MAPNQHLVEPQPEPRRIALDDKYENVIIIQGLHVDTGYPAFYFQIGWNDAAWLHEELGKALERKKARSEQKATNKKQKRK